jgi:hypothetical protein
VLTISVGDQHHIAPAPKFRSSVRKLLRQPVRHLNGHFIIFKQLAALIGDFFAIDKIEMVAGHTSTIATNVSRSARNATGLPTAGGPSWTFRPRRPKTDVF